MTEKTTPPLPVLVVLHQEHSTPGRVGWMLEQRGHALDIRRPRFGDPLPPTLSGHAGAVIFGGPMSANDDDDWLAREIDWIDVPLKEEKPFLGICLGAQMMVRRLGGRVFRHERDEVEIGWYPLAATEIGRRLGTWPSRVYQWHSEGFDLPTGAQLFATGERFPNQAIAVGPAAWGLQFHPEVTWAMMNRWTTRAHQRLTLPGAQPRRSHFEGRSLWDGETVGWAETFMDRWLEGRAAAAPALPARNETTPPPGGR
jgi:GMP synthase (glutamine-hydrolysing)